MAPRHYTESICVWLEAERRECGAMFDMNTRISRVSCAQMHSLVESTTLVFGTCDFTAQVLHSADTGHSCSRDEQISHSALIGSVDSVSNTRRSHVAASCMPKNAHTLCACVGTRSHCLQRRASWPKMHPHACARESCTHTR